MARHVEGHTCDCEGDCDCVSANADTDGCGCGGECCATETVARQDNVDSGGKAPVGMVPAQGSTRPS